MSAENAEREDCKAVARALCRVLLNGGDPEQPAIRWNGTEMDPQDFPAWHDYMDEARHAINELKSRGRYPRGEQ